LRNGREEWGSPKHKHGTAACEIIVDLAARFVRARAQSAALPDDPALRPTGVPRVFL
jgi:hypothetical protein